MGCCQAAYRVRASCSVPRKQPFLPSSSFHKPTAIRSTPSSTSRSPNPPLTLSPRRRQHRQQQQHQQTDGRNWLLSWNRAGSPCSFRSLCSLESFTFACHQEVLPSGVPCASFLLGSAKTAFSSFLFLQLADRHPKHSF